MKVTTDTRYPDGSTAYLVQHDNGSLWIRQNAEGETLDMRLRAGNGVSYLTIKQAKAAIERYKLWRGWRFGVPVSLALWVLVWWLVW